MRESQELRQPSTRSCSVLTLGARLASDTRSLGRLSWKVPVIELSAIGDSVVASLIPKVSLPSPVTGQMRSGARYCCFALAREATRRHNATRRRNICNMSRADSCHIRLICGSSRSRSANQRAQRFFGERLDHEGIESGGGGIRVILR